MKNFIICALFIHSVSFGQTPITLQTCIDMAQSNNIHYSSQNSSISISQIDRKFNTWSLLPNLSAYTGFNTSFGRRLDPFTNTFANTNVNSHSLGLSSSLTVFNGFSFIYRKNLFNATIKKEGISLRSKQNDIVIQVVENYFNLCKLLKQVEFTRIRIEKYKEIQNIQRLLINGGKINEVDTLKSHNSLLNEQTILLGLEMDLRIKTIGLNYLIGDSLSAAHIYVLESVSQTSGKLPFSEAYILEQLEQEKEIADNQINIDKSNVLPNLSLNALLGTGFSTNNKDFTLPGTPTKLYRDQISQNLYEGIGFYLSIPIFNRGAWLKSKQLYEIKNSERSITIQQNELLLEKQKLEVEQKKLKIWSELALTKQSVENFHTIYDKTFLLYSEGRITYIELETTFMDWQTKMLDLETLKLDQELLKLYE